MGVLDCHQLTPPNKMVELKTDELCVKNQGEFIGAIRVSRCRFGGKNDPFNSSVGSFLWETIVWIYNLTVMIVSQKE